MEPSSFCGSRVQGEWEEGLDLELGHAVSGEAGLACEFGYRVRGVQEPDLKAPEQGAWEWGRAFSLEAGLGSGAGPSSSGTSRCFGSSSHPGPHLLSGQPALGSGCAQSGGGGRVQASLLPQALRTLAIKDRVPLSFWAMTML